MKKGFTVIELLVVIAIIGLFSSIILVSLKGTRGAAKDVQIVANMRQMRTAAATIDIDYGGYNAVGAGREFNCSANATEDMKVLCDAIDELKGPNPNEFPTFRTTANEYCAYIELDSSEYYCIEENVAIRTYSDPADADCTASSWNCPTSTESTDGNGW